MSPTTFPILSRAFPNLIFQLTGDFTACETAEVRWQLPAGTSSAESSSPIDVSLISTTPFATGDGTLTTTKLLVSEIPAVLLGFNWPMVNVSPGTYSLMAIVDPGTRAQQTFNSGVFNVVEGQDTSCVPTAPTGVQGGSGLSSGIIALICIAVGIVVLSVPGIYYLLKRRVRQRRMEIMRELSDTRMYPVDAKPPASVYGGGSSPGSSPTTNQHHSPEVSPNTWRESSTFAPTPISPPPRRTSLPFSLLSPIRRDPNAKDDALPAVPESPDGGSGTSRENAASKATNTNSKSEPDAESSLVVPTHFNPVRRSKSSKRPVPLFTPTPTTDSPSSSSSASAQPTDTSSDEDASGAPLSRTTTNTTFTSLLSRSVPSIFRKSIPHQPAVYSAAKPESVFGMYVGDAKEGFDGRSAKSRPNSYYPTPARSPSPRFPSGVSAAASSHWAPPSAWSSSNSPNTPTMAHSPSARSFRSAGKQAARSSTLSVSHSLRDNGAGLGQGSRAPLPPIPPLPRPLPQPGMYRTSAPSTHSPVESSQPQESEKKG